MNFQDSNFANNAINIDLSTARLATLVSQKRKLVFELHKLVIKQRQMVDAAEVDFIPLLAIKQKVLEALNAVDRCMDPFRQQDPDRRLWTSPENREACRTQADQCEAVFRDVLEIENYCAQTMRRQQSMIQEQLQGSVTANHATRAYQQEANQPMNRFDLSSEG